MTQATTNAVANLLSLLLNQEGWSKGISEQMAAGVLLQLLPDERPADADPSWENAPFELELSTKQLKAAKRCFQFIAEKGNLLANPSVLALAKLLEWDIPSADASVEVVLPNIAAKYLADVFTMQGKVKNVPDLIQVCLLQPSFPKVPPLKDEPLREWMESTTTLKLTEKQRDIARQVLRNAADDGSIRVNKYVPALYTAFGLQDE